MRPAKERRIGCTQRPAKATRSTKARGAFGPPFLGSRRTAQIRGSGPLRASQFRRFIRHGCGSAAPKHSRNASLDHGTDESVGPTLETLAVQLPIISVPPRSHKALCDAPSDRFCGTSAKQGRLRSLSTVSRPTAESRPQLFKGELRRLTRSLV